MKMKWFLLTALAAQGTWAAETVSVRIDPGKVVAQANRADLLGLNIAVYNSPETYEKAIKGPLSDLDMGLVRIPGGSVSDKFYWNGNGVVVDGKVDTSKYHAPYWQVDYSAYKPGFVVDNLDWSKADPGFVRLDAKTMHVVTHEHPVAHNLVTVNVGTGTPEMAAEWVRWANIKNKWGVKYWELGNELNGNWEAGHIRPDGSKMTAEKYRDLFVRFADAMKAVDPTIMIGGPSCDVEHHEDYFEPLLRDAADKVDFITFHYYSLRSSLAPEKELFQGLDNLKPVVGRLDELVEKYMPQRKGKVEYCITEWNSKLPKDQDAYRLFNGLWFSAWVGEMLKDGVDSATVWDLVSGKDNGHGLLVQQEDGLETTGRYWAFWLWSHHMAGTMVETAVEGAGDLRVYATKNRDALYVMAMNPSRTEVRKLSLDIGGSNDWKSARQITLSSREYFWNPYAFRADWNSGPSEEPLALANPMEVAVPPYSVRIFEFDRNAKPVAQKPRKKGAPELRLLLPESGFADLPVEGWVRAFRKGSDKPYGEDLVGITLSVEGPAKLSAQKIDLYGAATRFVLMPTGPGKVVVKAKGAGLKAQATVKFRPVKLEEQVAWKFDGGKIEQPFSSEAKAEVAKLPGSETDYAMRVDIPAPAEKRNGLHLLDITAYPKSVPKARIGGVVFDARLGDGFQMASDDTGAIVQVVLQSTGAYWIPIGQVPLSELAGKGKTLKMEIPDKKFLQVMDRAFSIIFLVSSDKPVAGSLYLDNIGFLLRPE